MPLHAIFFTGILAFLSGITFISLELPFLYLCVPAAFLFGALFAFGAGVRVAFFAAFLLGTGGWYYLHDDARYRAQTANLPQEIKSSGIIASDPKFDSDWQSFSTRTSYGTLLIKTGFDYELSYGDAVDISGRIRPPQHDYFGMYLAKEHIVGIVDYPEIRPVASDQGNPVISILLDANHAMRDAYRTLLPPGHAALLAGVTLGTNADFSKAFLQKLSLSGTRHLTAVSGLNISIIVAAMLGGLVFLISRRLAFFITFLFILLYVAFVGFSASAIRAALMGFIAAFATIAGRQYAAHNALALAALLLALFNPKILVYDIGFQLSFVATIGIIYIEPVFRVLLKAEGAGFLGWKTSLFTTLSAQVATVPILIMQFQNFSFTALAANMLILGIIPFIMIGGFFAGLFSFLSHPLAHVLSVPLMPPLTYVLFIINLFAEYAVPFNPRLNGIFILLYYGILAVFLFWFYSKKRPRNTL